MFEMTTNSLLFLQLTHICVCVVGGCVCGVGGMLFNKDSIAEHPHCCYQDDCNPTSMQAGITI